MRQTTNDAASVVLPDDEIVAVEVWDWPVRLFHWSIVGLVAAAVITASIGGSAMVWHMRAGFAVLALVLFRILWGFAGTRHARFTSFLRGPRAVIAYFRSFTRGASPVVVGHAPPGGWAVIALLLVLLVQTGTGLFANDDVITDGPLMKFVSKDLSDTLTRYHYLNAWALGGLVGVHVAAVLWHWVAANENLVGPMLTGKKRLPRSLAAEGVDRVPHVRASILLAACVFAVWWMVSRL